MNQLSQLHLHDLREHQARALTTWQKTGNQSVPFAAWNEVYRAWSMAAEEQSTWLGHIAVLWQELDRVCAGQPWLPLLNQFIQIAFVGITPQMPRDFVPVLAADASSWHSEFNAIVRQIERPSADSSESAYALSVELVQYAVVFGRRALKRNREFLSRQRAELASARECQSSELFLATGAGPEVDWTPLIDILAEAVMDRQPEPTLLGESPTEKVATRQLIAYWAARAAWFRTIAAQLAPGLLPKPVPPCDAIPTALPAHAAADQYALLLGELDTRAWLLASERASPLVTLRGLGQDLDSARSAWAAQVPLAAPSLPEVQAVVEPQAGCRPLCWHLPSEYLRSMSPQPLGASMLALPDPGLIRLCDEVVQVQQPGAVIVVLNWEALHAGRSNAVVQGLGNAAGKLAAVLREGGTRLNGVDWFVVFDGVAEPERRAGANAQPQLVADYGAALRCASGALVRLPVSSLHDPISALLNEPACQGSLAFLDRVSTDLLALGALTQVLASLGFGNLHVAYTRSGPEECRAWTSYSALWKQLRTSLAANSFEGRRAYLTQAYCRELLEHTDRLGQKQGLGFTLPAHLDELSEGGGGAVSDAGAGLTGLFAKLCELVKERLPTANDYEPLWAAREAGQRHIERSSVAQSATLLQVVNVLLQELGIRNGHLSEFTWASDQVAPMGAAPTSEDWERLLALSAKPQPVAHDDPELAHLRLLEHPYDPVRGALCQYSLLRDFGPDPTTATLLYEHGHRDLGNLLLDPRVTLEAKTYALFNLRGYDPLPWRQAAQLKRGERNGLKFAARQFVEREVLVADLLLIHMLRLSSVAGGALKLGQTASSSLWQNRREQLLRLLDAGGFKADVAGEDPDAFKAALHRLIRLWKEFFQSRGPHRGKARAERVEALRRDYEQLCKPMTQPALHTDLAIESGAELERQAYVAACTVELIGRIQKPPRNSQMDLNALEVFNADDYTRRMRTLLGQYLRLKGRYLMRFAAFQLDEAKWLRGFGPERELVGRDALSAAHAEPSAHARRMALAIESALREMAQQHPSLAATVLGQPTPLSDTALR